MYLENVLHLSYMFKPLNIMHFRNVPSAISIN